MEIADRDGSRLKIRNYRKSCRARDCFKMASKVRKEAVTLRKIAKPVISSDVMGNRNVEVRAVGAWVQVESEDVEPEAVVSNKLT